MKIFTIRMRAGQDLRSSLLDFAKQNNLQAASILTCVGALSRAELRMAGATPNQQDIRIFDGKYEIVSLVGTLTAEDCHLHISIADKNGRVYGGHLKLGSIIDVTAEVVIIEDENTVYERKFDPETNFEELNIRKRSK